MNRLLIILRTLLVVGLIVSPLNSRVFAASGHAMAMSGMHEMHSAADEMSPRADVDNAVLPCHDGKMDCDKVCPCMAACMALSVQGLPSAAAAFIPVAITGHRFAIISEAQLASLTASPPARPPRA